MKPSRRKHSKRGRKGTSYVAVLILVTMLSGMAMAMIQTTSMEVKKAVNQREGLRARCAAESGVNFLTQKLRGFTVSQSAGPQQVLDALAQYLGSALPGGTVIYGGGEIQIAGLAIDPACGTFDGSFALNDAGEVVLDVTGQASQARHDVGMIFELIPGGQGIFSKGIVTGGPVVMGGNAHIMYVNDPGEAQVLSMTSQDVVFDMWGNSQIDGDVYASNASGQVDIDGNAKIASLIGTNPAIYEHIHFGVTAEEIPRPDPAVFAPYATTTLSGPTSGNRTFTNIRIPAGTNPNFSGNINLRGVIYVETPNVVTFSGNLDVKGVIVTEDAGETGHLSNSLRFTGNTTLRGVETLPDESQFAALKQMPGSMILAPGFGLCFSGNFGAVGGTLAANCFALSGNAGGTVRGCILSYSDLPFSMSGNSILRIDRSVYDQVPPGFSLPATLSAVSSTYTEY